MKKLLLLILALSLLWSGASAAALDRSAYVIASGTVEAAAFTDVLAPFSGTLLSFDLQPGDRVSVGETLLGMRTQILRAPLSGRITGVFAGEGEDASGVMARYGALAAIEPEYSYLVRATTTGAYNKSRNKELHIGETLYFQQNSGTKDDGVGQVISVSGDSYTLEIHSGDFSPRENVTLYRSAGYGYSEKVGTGTVARRDPLTVTGSGRIGKVYVRADSRVSADDPLFEILPADADPGAGSDVLCPCDGVIASVAVMPGQQVWKGALLARIYRTDRIEVVAEVDEMDLSRIRVGSVCPILLDMDEETVLQGQVSEINALGVTRQNAAWFRVHLSLENASHLPLGASASVYLPK
ncbi:MAG: HlyD family efflux transporter periplasmic adaptor subunit [Clostridia bacterium]|nr:HlyD family efflux transporter periplasmic adaptor subunit [Clostridia bacterium]